MFLYQKITIFFVLLILACHPNQGSRLKLGPVAEQKGPCDDISDADTKGACEHAHAALLQEQTQSSYANIVIEYDQRFIGEPMTISIDGNCLAAINDKVRSAPCEDLNENFKWHFVDVEVEYNWGGGVKLRDLAFHMVTRESMKRWHAHDKNISPTPKLECIDFYPLNLSYLEGMAKLRIVPCEESNLVFITVPNDTIGDANLYGSRWARVIAIDTRLPRFAPIKTAMQNLNPMLTQACNPGCTGSPELLKAWENYQRIDLGDIKWIKDSFVLLHGSYDPETSTDMAQFELLPGDYVSREATKICTENDPCIDRKDNIEDEILIGGCKPHRSDGEERCFSDEKQPLTTYKMFYHAVEEQRRGHVIQLRPSNDNCLLWNGESKSCTESRSIDKPDGPDASQYRMTFVSAPPGKTETYVQLQRVFPEKQSDDLICYDLEKQSASKCCADSRQCQGVYGYMLTWPPNSNSSNLVFHDSKTNLDKTMPISFCQTATNTQQFLAYDCVDYVAPIWKTLRSVADIVAMIPELGAIPSFILQNALCFSGEATISRQACQMVAVQGMSMLTNVLIDSVTVNGMTSAVIKELIRRQAIRKSAAIVADLGKSPALAMVVHSLVQNCAKKIVLTSVEQGIELSLDKTLPGVAKAVIFTALEKGVKGGSITTAFTPEGIDAMIASATKAAIAEAAQKPLTDDPSPQTPAPPLQPEAI